MSKDEVKLASGRKIEINEDFALDICDNCGESWTNVSKN